MELWFTCITSSIMKGQALVDAGDGSERSFATVGVVQLAHNNLGTDI